MTTGLLRFFISIFLVSVISRSAFGNSCSEITSASLRTAIADMTTGPDALPHGVPYDWANHPRLNKGNHPGDFSAITAWGQAYEAAGENSPANDRIQIRNIMLFVLSKRTGEWMPLQFSRSVEGANFKEDFSNNVALKADIRPESSGGISATLVRGYNFHFWPSVERRDIDGDDINGIFVSFEGRVMEASRSARSERRINHYVMDAGADYWRSPSIDWAPDQRNNDDVGMGRFKYITEEWQSFNMTTITKQQLISNPPPLAQFLAECLP